MIGSASFGGFGAKPTAAAATTGTDSKSTSGFGERI